MELDLIEHERSAAWRSIDTLQPGSQFVLLKAGELVGEGFWAEPDDRADSQEGWVFSYGADVSADGRVVYPPCEPTHWMPLPNGLT